jgi:hypothetical protein
LVYCAEAADNAQHVYNYMATPDHDLAAARVKKLTISGHETTAIVIDATHLNGAELEDEPLTLIPYYAWNNRGVGSMVVWLPDNFETLRRNALVIDDNAKQFRSAVATHTFELDRTAAMIDGRLPKSSFDKSIPRWTSWPKRGKPQSIVYELAAPIELRSAEVYWYDDRGGVQVPERWELEVWKDGAWHPFPLYTTDIYGVEPDQFNIVHTAHPLKVGRLRMRVWPRLEAASGILEFVVRSEMR